MSNLNTCVVCGRYSTRSSWNNTITVVDGTDYGTTYVACDFHSINDFETALGNSGVAGFAPSPSTVNTDTIGIDESPQT